MDTDLPVIPVTSYGFFQGLTVNVSVHSQPFTAFFDTGASVNIIKADAFKAIATNSNHHIPTYAPDLRVSGISGNTVCPISKVYLHVSLSPAEPVIKDYFYVIDNVSFQADILIGFHTMCNFNLSLFPMTRNVAQNATLISAITPPDTLPFPTVSTVQSRSNSESSHSFSSSPTEIEPSLPLTADSPSDKLPADTNLPPLSDLVDRAKPRSAVLTSSVKLSQHELSLVRVKVNGVTPGTDILCCSDDSRVTGVAVESVLTTLGSDGTCMIGLQNLTNSPISLKSGVFICHVLPYSAPVKATDLPSLPVLTSVSSPAVTVSASPPPPLTDQHLGQTDFPHVKDELLSLLNAFRHCVSLHDEPLGRTSLVRHSIHLYPDSKPTYVPAYRIPHSRRTLVDAAVRDMIDNDVVEPAASPFNAPLLLVPKPGGEHRVVVDFRELNTLTIPDRFPVPVLTDLLQSIGDSNGVFSTIDLQSGFFQVELEESSRPYTAFTTASGQFMFKRMAMGLRNSPLTFTRLMNSVLSGLLGNSVFCYLDDLIIASKDPHEHLATLNQVLSRFSDAGLKLKLSKCSFLKKEIKFLGHKVDKDGIHTLDDKVHAVSNFPVPKSAEQVRSFLGLSGFYRQFIKDFSKIAEPLSSLLKKDVPFEWSDAQETAFQSLKTALSTAPVLAFPNFKDDFYLCTDASNVGIGAVLMQKFSGKFRAIAYASRLLNKPERNYSVTDREALAVVWALRHFRVLILGYKIHVLTDHYAVTEIFKGTNLTDKFARWQLTVNTFNPSFSYLPGKLNTVADALSRNVAPVFHFSPSQSLPTMDEIKEQQRSDAFCSSIIYYLQSGDSNNLPKLPMSPDSFSLQDDVLYKSSTVQSEDSSNQVLQLVIPETLVPVFLYHIHDSPMAGHPGKDRSLKQAQRSYFWPSMRKDIHRHWLLCSSCAKHRPTRHHESPSLPYPIATAPWESVSVDILKLPLTENGFQYLLVFIDSFSRFSVLTPLKDKSALSVAKSLIDDVICRYASPRILLSDNGTEFNNAILQSVCESFQIKKCNILPHAPQANGKVERANRRILDILRFITNSTSSWDTWIPQVACSLNSAIHSSINESPHFVLYGTDKRLPYEFLLSRPVPIYNFDDYIKCRLNEFQRIHTIIHDRLSVSQADMLQKQHQRATPHVINVGDVVFTRIHDRHSKLDSRFNGPYRVLEVMHGHKLKLLDLHSFTESVIHRDHVKLVNRGFDQHSDAQPPRHVSDGVESSVPSSSISPQSSSTSDYCSKLRSHSTLLVTPSPFCSPPVYFQ